MNQMLKTVKGLWSLLVGLRITGSEFYKPWLTVHYPRQEVENLSTYRGHIELVPSDEDPATPRCKICWTCADACPSGCITIRAHAANGDSGAAGAGGPLLLSPELSVPQSRHAAPPPEKIERVLDLFRLNYGLCSLCGLCVQSCPADAIRFSRDVYLADFDARSFQFDLIERLRAQAAARQTRAN